MIAEIDNNRNRSVRGHLFGTVHAGAGKDDSRAKACQLLPLDAELWTPRRGVVNAAQAAGRTEAALIAYHGARIVAGSTRESAPAPALSA
jgi:hypothetical protein